MAIGTNPIAEQSKQWMVQSLMDLMGEKPYQTITILEITKRAQLARRTFYRNFTGKQDIIYYYFSQLFEEYFEELAAQPAYSYNYVVKAFFTFWLQHKPFLVILKQNGLLFLALDSFNQELPKLYTKLKGNLSEFSSPEEQRLALLFSVGGCWNILFDILESGAEQTPAMLGKMTINILKAVYDRL